MRKQITIPRAYTPANNDIGNYNQVTGLNYEFWYAEIGDVKNLLGEATYNLGLLCKSSNINKWAAFKPTKFQNQTNPRHYHGMFPDHGASIPYDWQYHKPTGGSAEPYCLDHFLGYNHNAITPAFNGHDPTTEMTKLWRAEGDDYYWEDHEEEKEIQIEMRIPEWDITGFSAGGYIIDRGWALLEVDGELVAVEDTIIQDSDLNNGYFYVICAFTPKAAWSVYPAADKPFKIECYLGDDNGEDETLSGVGEYYANFPSDAGGVVKVEGNMKWRYEYDCMSFSWDKQGGGAGTGSVRIKKDRVGSEDDEIVYDANELWTEEVNCQGANLDGWYQFSDLTEYNFQTDLLYQFADGVYTGNSAVI